MKNIFIYSLLLIFAISACASTSNIEPEELTQPSSHPNIDASSITPDLLTHEAEMQGEQLIQTTQISSVTSEDNPIEKAKEDLAQRRGVSVENIKVVAVISQEFSIDAFYCHATKDRIAKEESQQVLLGQSILLSALGSRYEYHANEQMVIFCQPLR